jgi:hypothetical protein
MAVQRTIVGIAGASGAAYGVAALKELCAAGAEADPVISSSGTVDFCFVIPGFRCMYGADASRKTKVLTGNPSGVRMH